eukprot:5334685-Alexandrium_andersonii.AAC.1
MPPELLKWVNLCCSACLPAKRQASRTADHTHRDFPLVKGRCKSWDLQELGVDPSRGGRHGVPSCPKVHSHLHPEVPGVGQALAQEEPHVRSHGVL